MSGDIDTYFHLYLMIGLDKGIKCMIVLSQKEGKIGPYCTYLFTHGLKNVRIFSSDFVIVTHCVIAKATETCFQRLS